jgi:type II secretory pathway component PulF
LFSLPLRRRERAQLVLDLLAGGLKRGHSAEQTFIAAAGSRDRSLGARFHLLAAHLETGQRLGAALGKVPGLLPKTMTAMLQAGEHAGDLARVLPACQRLLRDGLSQTRGAMNYLVVLVFVVTPITPLVFLTLRTYVFPRLKLIAQDMEVAWPSLTAFVFGEEHWFQVIGLALALGLYGGAGCYVGGPRLASWLQARGVPWLDWLDWRLPWRRRRMQRDFAGLLALLLDAGLAEERALALAADGTANRWFIQHAQRAIARLRGGTKLTEAVAALDESGEFRWRLTTASQGRGGFMAALDGWLEALEAKAFQQEQAAAQSITTGLVLFNGVMVGLLVVSTFQVLLSIINAGVFW